MPQPKLHKNAAQRQDAYRSRHPKVTQARLAGLARSINCVVEDDSQHEHRRLPADIVGGDIVQTLRNLICWIDPIKDTISHPDWDHFHPERAHEKGHFH